MENKEYVKKNGNKLNLVKAIIGKKYKLTRRDIIISITSGVLTLLLLFSIGAAKKKKEINDNNQLIIEQFYEANELEQRVLSYLEISEELNDLKLHKYEASDNLFVQYGIGDELKSPEQLKESIKQFKELSISFDKHDLIQNNDIIKSILTLKKQEELVNSYIFSTGYDVANSNITKVTKDMAAESFGLDPNNITFSYDYTDGNDVDIVRMEVRDPKTGYTNVYKIKDKMFNDVGGNIISGVKSMVNTNTEYDHDKNDNTLYNETRNNRIKNAMNKTALFMNEVDTNDLYDKDLNEDFNENSNRKLY